MALLVMLLPLLGVELEEQLIAGFVATVYAIGRAVVKARAAQAGQAAEIGISVENVELEYSDEELEGLGLLLKGWWNSRDTEDWAGLARVLIRRVQRDLDKALAK